MIVRSTSYMIFEISIMSVCGVFMGLWCFFSSGRLATDDLEREFFGAPSSESNTSSDA